MVTALERPGSRCARTPGRSACTPPTPRSTGSRRSRSSGRAPPTRSRPRSAVARETGVPFTSRGAGTSVAGNAVGRGVVLDFCRHLNRVLSVDPEARTAVVEPGTVHAVLQRAVDAVRRPVRARPVDPHPLHDRRDDRQQRLRVALAGLRPDLGQRRRAGAADRGRRDLADRVRRRRRAVHAGRRDGAGRRPRRDGQRTSPRRGPSWAASAGRSPATPRSTCCPSASTRPRRSSAPRAPWP